MTFWIVTFPDLAFWLSTATLAAIVALVLGHSIWRGSHLALRDASDFDVQVYRDQLSEIERDVKRGVVPAADAERVRTEISRRILAADAAQKSRVKTGKAPNFAVILTSTVLLIGGSLALYSKLGQPSYGDMALADRIAYAEGLRENRPSQQDAMDSLPADLPKPQISAQYARLLDQLRNTVATRPNDLQGHLFLAEYEANVGNFAAAAAAQKTVLRIKGTAATAEDIGDYAELLVLAAGGFVSPEAEVALRAALDQDSENGRARYYLGLMLVQTGRPDIAFRLWDGLLRRGPADALWMDPIKSQIMEIAQLAGVDYTIPEPSNTAPGPSAEDIQAAGEMTPQERMEMIGSMVAGLSDRLATEGGPPQDWARLITSLGVLGETTQARAIFDNAIEVFAADPAALDLIRAAGSQAGVAE